MSETKSKIGAGVITGDGVQEIFKVAKANKFALPAVNVVSTNTINAVLEAAAAVKSPVIIQFSNGGAQFIAGKGLSNENQKAAIEIYGKAFFSKDQFSFYFYKNEQQTNQTIGA